VKRRVALGLFLLFMGLVGLRATPVPDATARSREVQSLATVIPLIDEIDLRSYRDENGCRAIEYRAGIFISDLGGKICPYIEPSGITFTDESNEDYQRFRQSLANCHVAVFSVYVVDAYDPNAGGNNRQIVFDLIERAVGRWAYVYEPGHERAAAATDTYIDIDQDWYFIAWDPGQQ
jgi:hypothetical protein